MSGEQQYYNPIIQAMAQTAQLSQQRERDVTAAKQHSEDLKLRQQHEDQQQKQQEREFKLRQDELKQQNDHHQATLANATKLLEATIAQKHQMEIKNARDMIANGVGKEAYKNPGTGVNTASMPGVPQNPGVQPNLPDPNKTPDGQITIDGQNLPEGAFPSPEQESKMIQDRAFAKSQGTATGALDPKIQVIEKQQQGQKDLAGINNTSRENIAKGNNATRIATTRATIAAHEKLKKDSPEINPGDLNNTVNDIYLTGNTPFTSIPAKTREAIRNSSPTGWTPIDPKDKPKLDNVSVVGDILNIGKQLADYSWDKNPAEALKGAGGFGEVGKLKNQLTGLGGQLAEVFSKEGGRKTDADIKRAVELIYSPKLNAQQNSDNVKKAEGILKDLLKPIISKYPKDQLEGILSHRGIDPKLIINDSYGFTNKQSLENRKKKDPLGILD